MEIFGIPLGPLGVLIVMVVGLFAARRWLFGAGDGDGWGDDGGDSGGGN